MKTVKNSLILILMLLTYDSQVYSQYAKGTPSARRVGVHRGNQVRTVFTNYGVIGQPGSQGPQVAWKFDNNGYAADVQPLVGVRLPIQDYRVNGVYDGIPDTLFSVIGSNADRAGEPDLDPGGGTFWGFEAIPGFFNPNLDETGKGVAMSHLPETWPEFWPDHPDWLDENGNPEWNGYFGRGIKSADIESYWMMDDNRDEKMFLIHGFLPDSTDPSRKGQGIRVTGRGLQWSNFLAQNVIFWVYDVTNIGTSTYDQVVFGTLIGTFVGVSSLGGGDEWLDDASFFNIRESITYTHDFDNYIGPSSNPRWKPDPRAVGYIGYAFLESPGNPFDGIDNDGDNSEYNPTAPYFREDDFRPRRVRTGDKLILIQKDTFERSTFIMPNAPTTVISMGREYHLIPDTTVLEEGNMKGLTLNKNASDGLDNDLDGLIDENYQLHYRQFKETVEGLVLIDTLNPVQHKDYINGVGLNDLMIDEARNDGIDNDGDWDPQLHDVGADGKPDTNDPGESDGVPTEGEPSFDSKDIDESDQIGLTSFNFFVPAGEIDMGDENDVWQRMIPGRFDVPESVVDNRATRGDDGDFIFSSGYFPLLPGRTERFSMALVFGEDLKSVIRAKNMAQIIYDANYNFPRPPDKPTLNAVQGDGEITLYWDRVAENTFDQALKENDFEGYKIYKGTDPEFSDAKTVSDGYGNLVDYQPIAQFDLKNGIKGFFNSDPILYQLSGGKPFYLGDDTSIKNRYVDRDVINGKTYYYAVTAYDRGSESESIYPSENTKFISIDASGNVTTDKNTVVVNPSSPIAGYVPPPTGIRLSRISGASTAIPYVEVVDPPKVKNITYFLTFTDAIIQGVNIASAYNLTDSASGNTIVKDNINILETNGDVFDGLSFSLDPHYQSLDNIVLDTVNSRWNTNDSELLESLVSQFEWNDIKGIRYPYDYMFVFDDVYNETTSRLISIFGNNSPLKVKNTNFAVYDITDRNSATKVQYGFVDKVGAYQDTLSDFDAVYLSNDDGTELSWRVVFKGKDAKVPAAGDTLFLSFLKPFSNKDVFVYRSKSSDYDANLARTQLDAIRAVPNPYVVTNVFERPLSSQVRGRGERVVYFTNLPANSKIRIYASNGNHIRTLMHEGDLHDGSVSWDLRTKEGLDIAFGIYFYVVEVKGIDRVKTGKLAVIK